MALQQYWSLDGRVNSLQAPATLASYFTLPESRSISRSVLLSEVRSFFCSLRKELFSAPALHNWWTPFCSSNLHDQEVPLISFFPCNKCFQSNMVKVTLVHLHPDNFLVLHSGYYLSHPSGSKRHKKRTCRSGAWHRWSARLRYVCIQLPTYKQSYIPHAALSIFNFVLYRSNL